MAFFRIKNIKGKGYAYLVENEWKRKGSRQSVKGYLGRAYRFDLTDEADFFQYKKIDNLENYINENNAKTIIRDLIHWELHKFGIETGIFLVDLESYKVKKNKREVVFAINEGFMCGPTLRNLLEFKPTDDEQADGFRLARAFVEAGIKIPQEIFIGLFGKFYIKQER